MKLVSCHRLRHTYCSLLLSQNVPIQTVSKYMGHSDSTVTLKVYSHFIPDTQDTALNALNNITTYKNDREFISVVAACRQTPRIDFVGFVYPVFYIKLNFFV